MKQPNLIILVVLSYVILGFACSKGEKPSSTEQAGPSFISTPRSTQEKLVDNKKKWNEQNIRNYDYELSAEGYLMAFAPIVAVSIRDGKLVSIKTPDGKPVTYLRIYERFSTVEKIFTFLDEVERRRPDRLHIAYDEKTGYPTHVDLDEKEGMSDDELTLRIKSLQIHN